MSEVRRVSVRTGWAVYGLMAGCLVWSGCSSENGTGVDDVGADVVPVQDVQDVSVPDTEPTEDGAEEIDTTPPPECAEGESRCASSGGEASELCNEDGEWVRFDCNAADVCFEGVCQTPGVCEPLAVEACEGCNSYRGCNAIGSATGVFDVPFNQTCQDVDGVPTLIARVCLPGEGRCIDDRTLEACDECGLGFQFATNCFEDDRTTICDIDRCEPLCEYIVKTDSYVGCEYWAVDLDNAFLVQGGSSLDADGQVFAVVVSNPTPEVDAEVVVSLYDREFTRVTVPSGGLEIIPMHDFTVGGRAGTPITDIEGTEIDYNAIRLQSTVPIVAYQFNPLDNEEVYSNDASLLFPTSSLGTEYLVMTRRQTFDVLKGYLTVAAVLPGTTEVTLEFPEYTAENPLITLGGRDEVRRVNIPPMRGGQTYTVDLEQYMVLNVSTDRAGADLTGTRVTSNRPVAVFGGSEAANAPNDDSCVYRASFDDWVCEATRLTASPRPCVNDAGEPDISLCADYITCCADHLEHQMLPLFAWGRRYNATRSAPRGDEADVWRVMAGRDNVTVELLGLPDSWFLRDLVPRVREYTLDEGEWFEVQSPVDFEIVADGPVMVGQFLAAEQAPYPDEIDAQQPPHADADTGDPAFILAVPVEQYRTDYTVLAPNAFEFDWATITAPTDSVVVLDGEEIPADQWTVFGRGEYHSARVPLQDGVHTLSGDQPFGIMVHGYDSYVSYGYAGGLDLRRIFDSE